MIRILLIVATVLLISTVSLGIWLTSQYRWDGLQSAKITKNGEPIESGKTYKRSNGDILISYDSTNGTSQYILYPDKKLIGIPNGDQFMYLPMYAFSKDIEPPVVINTNRVKIETEMNLIVEDSHIEFTTSDGSRIKLTF